METNATASESQRLNLTNVANGVADNYETIADRLEQFADRIFGRDNDPKATGSKPMRNGNLESAIHANIPTAERLHKALDELTDRVG